MTRNLMLKAALSYAARGWRVLPLSGKQPIGVFVPRGFKDATTDETSIRLWWKSRPNAGIGICTGNGLVVLDVDPRNGGDVSLSELLSQYGELNTMTVRTGGGGLHFYFVTEGQIKSASNVLPGIDVKGEGGYVVAAGSIHPSGEKYEFFTAENVAPASIPSWLIELVNTRSRSSKKRDASTEARILEGERNSKLISIAGSLRRRGLGEEDILETLRVVNARQCEIPLEESEIREIARSIMRYPTGASRMLESSRIDLTDVGNANFLITLHGSKIRFVSEWLSWLVWTGQHWVRDDEGIHVMELAKDVGRSLIQSASTNDLEEAKRRADWAIKSLSASRIEAMAKLARGVPSITVRPTQLDQDPWLLGVVNGVVDLRNGRLRPADPTDLMCMQAPVQWDEHATAPRWVRAMEEWFPDPAVRSYVQRLVGAALVGKQRDHLFVVHYGGGANGKGTFMRALFTMLGPYVVVPHLSLLVNTRYEQHATVKASLYRTRLAIAAETQRRVHLNEASIKNLTGDDPISCRRMYENEWTFQPSHMLWLQTNYLPEITGRDHGIWRRIRVVPWTETFEGQREEDLGEVLKAEAPGILQWAVAGCLEWQRTGLAEPDAVLRRTTEYQEDQDIFTRFMADAGLTLDPKLEIAVEELNKNYDEWADSQGTGVPYKEFAGWLKDQGCTKNRRRVPAYRGAPTSVQKWYYEPAQVAKRHTPGTHRTRKRPP